MVRRLYGDSLERSNIKKETEDEGSPERRSGAELRLRQGRLPLQPLHLQELQLLIAQSSTPLALAGGRTLLFKRSLS
jgi:hypothetical protein